MLYQQSIASIPPAGPDDLGLPVVAYAGPLQQPKPVAGFVSPLDEEPPAKRRLFALLALALVAGVVWMNASYWVPAHPGVDQNAYLVGGRQVARLGSPRLDPINPADGSFDPYSFVGMMWVGADLGTNAERYYPKYPIGLPLLIGGACRVGDVLDGWTGQKVPTWGTILTFWISPVSTALAVWGMFFIARFLAGSLPGFLGAILLAMSPVTLELANNPNSHASTLFCVTWGGYLMMIWWHRGGAWRASLAGLLLGFAALIRYSEATMILPLGLMVAFRFGARWIELCRSRKGYRSAGVSAYRGVPQAANPHTPTSPYSHTALLRPAIESILAIAWWAIPVVFLICFNLKSVKTWTGYDPTNESIGFDLDYFNDNWEPMLRQINSMGMFFIFPLALVGLVWMFFHRWQLALMFATWILPNLAIYAAYYWAPDAQGGMMRVGYLRFFLSVFPALIACAIWLIGHVAQLASRPLSRAQHVGALLACAALCVGAAGLHDPVARIIGEQPQSPALAAMVREGWFAWASRAASCLAGGLVFAGLWLLSRWIEGQRQAQRGAIGAALVAGCLTAVCVLENWELTSPNLEREHRQQLVLDLNTRHILNEAPADSFVFLGDRGQINSLANHLQFAGHTYRLYTSDAFSRDVIDRLDRMSRFGRGEARPDDPTFLDPKRSQTMRDRLRNTSPADLLRAQRQIIYSALDSGRRVFFLLPRQSGDPLPSGRSDGRPRSMPPTVDRVLRDPDESERDLDARVVSAWSYSLPPPPVETSRVRGRFGGPFGGRGFGRGFEGPQGQAWQLIEVRTIASSASAAR